MDNTSKCEECTAPDGHHEQGCHAPPRRCPLPQEGVRRVTLLPFSPIEDEVARRTWPLTPTCDEIACVVGILPRRWARMKQRGGLTVWEADELACALGRHPGSLWPEWCDAIDAEVERTEARRAKRGRRQVVAA